jgi:hypothetical protein
MPCAALTARLKAAVGTARRASRQLPRPALRAMPDRRPALRAAVPTASPTCRVPTVASPTVPPSRPLIDAAPPSAVPVPVSRCSSAACRAPAPCRHQLVEQRHRAPCSARRARRAGRGRAGPPALRTRAVQAAPAEAVGRVAVGRAVHCASGPSGFGPVAPG